MARWVSFVKAQAFPAVKNKYKTTGGFRRAVKAEANGAKVWARRRTTATLPYGDADWQVDVAAIPKVRPLTAQGVVT